MNPQVRTLPGTVPGTFRNTDVENHYPNRDRSQNDPRPQVASSVYQSHHAVDAEPDEVPHNEQSTVCRLLDLVGKSLRYSHLKRFVSSMLIKEIMDHHPCFIHEVL